jgi:hypothetical protein
MNLIYKFNFLISHIKLKPYVLRIKIILPRFLSHKNIYNYKYRQTNCPSFKLLFFNLNLLVIKILFFFKFRVLGIFCVPFRVLGNYIFGTFLFRVLGRFWPDQSVPCFRYPPFRVRSVPYFRHTH